MGAARPTASSIVACTTCLGSVQEPGGGGREEKRGPGSYSLTQNWRKTPASGSTATLTPSVLHRTVVRGGRVRAQRRSREGGTKAESSRSACRVRVSQSVSFLRSASRCSRITAGGGSQSGL